MPIEYTFLDPPSVHLVSYQGIVSNADFLNAYKAAAVDPRFRPGMPEISDFRYAEALDIDLTTIREFVSWVAGREDLVDSPLRCGILVGNDMQIGLSQLYEAVSATSTNESIRRFWDLSSLLAWLPVDASHAGRISSALDALAQQKSTPNSS